MLTTGRHITDEEPRIAPRIRWLTSGVLVLMVAITASGCGGDGGLGVVGPLPNRVVTGPDRDVPCREKDDGTLVCATPLPDLTPAESSHGVALRIERFEIELDHVGPYRVALGEAVLSRGIVTELSFRLESADRDDFLAPDFRLILEDNATRAVQPANVFEKGVVDGVQRVTVYVAFDLESYGKGSVVVLREVVVR